MPRTATITLDGVEYTIRAFNIGQLEAIAAAGNNAWTVLRTALERADPKVVDPNLIEPTPPELEAAFKTIMKLAGLKEPEASPLLPPAIPAG